MHIPHATGTLWHFHGGIHLADKKKMSLDSAIHTLDIPPLLHMPIGQHIGHKATPCVNVGDHVLKGQIIAEHEGRISANIHASSSGTVVAIELQAIPHPSGLPDTCIVIETDGKDEWCELPYPMPHFNSLDKDEVLERIKWAGIVGLGGATFPTNVKLHPGAGRHINTLIINGAECEPYITCDDKLMIERADNVIAGVAVMAYLTEAEKTVIGIEDNKPDAIAAMKEALKYNSMSDIEIKAIPTLYPSGGERQLIKIITGKEVPAKGIPADIGIVCQNVGTAAAVASALFECTPQISRIMTITGESIAKPQNIEVLLGTPMDWIVEQIGGFRAQASRFLMGGPMMGYTIETLSLPVTKGINCLLAPTEEEMPERDKARACIRCGRCAEVCPVQLLPQQLYWFSRAKDHEGVQKYNLFDCIECGCCSYVCPSDIPLVHYYRFTKNAIWQAEKEQKKSERARIRHEARLERLERIKAERKARLRKKKEVLDKKPSAGKAPVDAKKAAIDAAMKRVADKKAKSDASAGNTKNLTAVQQKQIDEANERRGSNPAKPSSKSTSESNV